MSIVIQTYVILYIYVCALYFPYNLEVIYMCIYMSILYYIILHYIIYSICAYMSYKGSSRDREPEAMGMID